MEMLINRDLEVLWREYIKTKNVDLRNQLIELHIYLVKHVVNRMWGSYSHLKRKEDLISCGVIGLIDAIDRFDLSRGVKFETYAYFRIRGEIIDQLRKEDWIPKNVRNQVKVIESALVHLENKFGRTPTEEEIAKHTDLSLENVRKYLGQYHSLTMISLDEQLQESSLGSLLADNKSISPEEFACQNELKNELAKVINSLAENEKVVVSLYYFEEMNLKEIGAVLGVSESRVSQIHTKALMRIKNKLGMYRKTFDEE